MSAYTTTEVEADGRTVSITEHRETPAQGGERYVRCESCGRELLSSLGGADALLHADGCALRGDAE
jgi:hypothetical protein